MWEESTIPGGPYTSITAPLASPGTTILATTTKYYRAAVTCGASTTYSSEVLVTVGAVSGTATTPSTSICVELHRECARDVVYCSCWFYHYRLASDGSNDR